jgi:pSer/pThr/pTyr-binding forkhead associated (FHA) protein/TolA-binding protein
MVKIKVLEDSNLFFEQEISEATTVLLGRGSTSDIVFEGHPGISRSHLKLTVREDFSVLVELVSQTGKLIHLGENIKELEITDGEKVVSVPPYDIHIECPSQQKADEKAESISLEEENDTTAQVQELDLKSSDQPLSPTGFDDDEKTKTAVSSPMNYYIKVFKGDRLLQEIALEGDSWDFGRDPNCHYTIKSKKTSRRHFSIINSRSKFFVKDLSSANGTFLNKQQLPVNQEIELKSGDFIEVAEFKFIFEIKDHSFQQKVKNVALIEEFGQPETEHDPQELAQIRASALALGDEFMKLPEKDRPSNIAHSKAPKKNHLRHALVAIILILGIFYYIQDNKPKMDSAELASLQEEKRLAKERANAALDKFNLALRFFNESQFERCMLEIDEFFKYDIELEETAGATELKNQCEIEKERLQRKRDLEIQEEKRLAIERKINEIVENCTPQAEEGTAVLKPCVDEALSLDPSNEDVQRLMDVAEAADLRREQERINAEKYRKRVASGKALFRKAKDYDKFGDWKRALKAYQKHIESKYPDPSKLKKVSKRNIASINTRIDSVLDSALSESKRFLEDDDYKNAILSANKGLDVNRDHPELLKTKARAEKNLKIILRKYYQESIIQEDFGQTGEAITLWKKIIEQGVKGSDYYQKAKLKLRYYEEGV